MTMTTFTHSLIISAFYNENQYDAIKFISFSSQFFDLFLHGNWALDYEYFWNQNTYFIQLLHLCTLICWIFIAYIVNMSWIRTLDEFSIISSSGHLFTSAVLLNILFPIGSQIFFKFGQLSAILYILISVSAVQYSRQMNSSWSQPVTKFMRLSSSKS